MPLGTAIAVEEAAPQLAAAAEAWIRAAVRPDRPVWNATGSSSEFRGRPRSDPAKQEPARNRPLGKTGLPEESCAEELGRDSTDAGGSEERTARVSPCRHRRSVRIDEREREPRQRGAPVAEGVARRSSEVRRSCHERDSDQVEVLPDVTPGEQDCGGVASYRAERACPAETPISARRPACRSLGGKDEVAREDSGWLASSPGEESGRRKPTSTKTGFRHLRDHPLDGGRYPTSGDLHLSSAREASTLL